ncbi:hypothetical protein [Pedobacter sp. MR22-3]|uniref:hypothetical protein n=1 Tax=Pedobacter sp. MR22-3 TaxID=2994552 RepID=UPI0022455D01|nr:hypothetical protein [Pedobacter sp. MR22-3]MCX2582710.1 hypothetical protein [Pedobacter sp. MR22-3]
MLFDQVEFFASSGTYLPSFFKMEIGSEESFLDIQNLSEKAASTYFHEYMHFIQDVSTFHGLSNIIRMGEYIHHCREIIENGSTVFSVPIHPAQLDPGVKVTTDITNKLLGSVHNIVGQVDIEHVELRKTSVITSEQANIPELIITFNDGRHYTFGSLAVSESMAYIAEKILFPASVLAPTLPYHAAELLSRFLFPEFAVDKLNIFALCDISLMTAEPGPKFYQNLLKLRDSAYTNGNPKKIYEYFSNDIFFYQNQKLARIQMLSALGQIAKCYLAGYFPSKMFKANIEWMDHIIDHGLGLRNRNIAFPLDIVLHGSFYDNPELKLTMRNIGGPLQLNAKSSGTFIVIEELAGKYIQPDLNWAIANILKILIGIQVPCGMKSFCRASAVAGGVPDYTNALCDINPWFRAYQDLDCSMTRVLKMWQLNRKIPNTVQSE